MAIIGILGGMGPMATVDLFTKIIQNTPARCDQEHIRIIIDNHPQIPSRVAAILEGGESPLPKLIESAKLLENAGASFIVIPCNTAHYWYDQLQAAINIPIYHIIDNAATYIQTHYAAANIMLLATNATVKTGLYQKSFTARGMALHVPEPDHQKIVDAALEDVKAGYIADNHYLPPLQRILDQYAHDGIQAIIGGCTEIPLLFPYLQGNYQKFDPTLMLARTAVEKALFHQAVHGTATGKTAAAQ